MRKIKVIVADDQTLICSGIRILLESFPDIEVVAIAENGCEALSLTALYQPDVVLMDIRMPVMDGIEALREIKNRYPKIIVLMLTTFDPDDYIIRAFHSGADGYLLKDATSDMLVESIRSAFNGNSILPASIAAKIIAHIPKDIRRTSLSDYGLTQRETKIAYLISKGYNNEKISSELGISMGTVKNYVSTLYSKLEVKNRQEAIYIIRGLGEKIVI